MKFSHFHAFRACRILLAPEGDNATGTMEPKAFQKTMLDGLASIKEGQGEAKKKMSELDLAFKKVNEEAEIIRADHAEIKKLFLAAQKNRLSAQKRTVNPDGRVSDDCARMLAAYAILDAVQCNKFADGLIAQRAHGIFKEITGVEAKSALTSSDIPLPVGYSGEVAELVYQYSLARQHGTVFPLPNGTFKTPKLGTDPTFGLIGASASVTEKSPTFGWVTFNAEKFGGLVRLPSEIDEDSIVAVGQFVARYAARQMGRVEDWNFFRGTGAATGVNGTAEGLTKSCVTDGIKLDQASTKTKQSDMTLDNLRDLRSASGVSGAVLGTAKYHMHPTYEAALVKFNTSATVTPFVRNGKQATLDGYEIVWNSSMPVYSTSASASLGHVLFGDVSWNYLGTRGGMRFDTSKEAAFATDEVLIRALERFTIGKMAVDCVAVLVTAAS